MAALGLAVLAVSAALARGLWPHPSAVAEATVPKAPAVTSVSVPLVSENDLRTLDLPGVHRQVAATAELFLSEFFTISTPGVRSVAGGESVPVGLASGPDGAARAFVDSVHVLNVDTVGDGVFRVRAVVRMLEDPDGGGFRRLDPRTYQLEIRMLDSIVVVTSLPIPTASAPFGGLDVGDPQPTPPEILAAAVDKAALFGVPDSGSALGRRSQHGWRVTVVVTDQLGVAWPLDFEVDD